MISTYVREPPPAKVSTRWINLNDLAVSFRFSNISYLESTYIHLNDSYHTPTHSNLPVTSTDALNGSQPEKNDFNVILRTRRKANITVLNLSH